MPLTLDAPKQVNETIASFKITSFAVDNVRQEIHIGFVYLDGTGAVIPGPDRSRVLRDLDFVAAVTRSEAINATNPGVYESIKTALYEFLETLEGVTGVIQ